MEGRSLLKIIAIVLAVAVLFIIIGLFVQRSKGQSNTSSSQQEEPAKKAIKSDWEFTGYSLDDIKAKGFEGSAFKAKQKPEEDESDEALNAYNAMLGYVENVAKLQGYKIFDYYFSGEESGEPGYVIKIVPDEYTGSFAVGTEQDNAVILSCDRQGNDLKQQLDGFLKVRKLIADLDADIKAIDENVYVLNRYHSYDKKLTSPAELDTEPGSDDYKNMLRVNDIDSGIFIVAPADMTEEQGKELLDKARVTLLRYNILTIYMVALEEEYYDAYKDNLSFISVFEICDEDDYVWDITRQIV